MFDYLAEFSTPLRLATVEEGVELSVRFPWIAVVLSVLRYCGVVVDTIVSVQRPPLTWWETIWSWFGYTYKEQRFEIHLDFVRSAVLCAWLCLALLLMATLIRKLVVHTLNPLLLVVMRLSAASHKLVLTSRVFRWLASMLEPGSVVATVIPNPSEVSYFAETLRVGSSMVKYPAPDCQVLLGYLENGVFQTFGCGIRVDIPTVDGPFIITPLHVYSRCGDSFAVRGKSGTVTVDRLKLQNGLFSGDRLHFDLDLDVCAFQLTPVEASQIGVRRATITPFVPSHGAMARVVGPAGVGSLGTLSTDPHSFGQLIYAGSTEPGFSGAGYVLGNGVAGIHTAGGHRNVGFSLRLAYVTLAHHCKVHGEETAEWLEDLFRVKKRKARIDNTWQDNDSYRIQIDGLYHIVGVSDMKKAMGRDIAVHEQSVCYDDDPKDYRPQSTSQGNAPSMSTQASSSSSDYVQATLQTLLSSMQQLQGSLKKTQAQKPSGSQRKNNSAGPTQQAQLTSPPSPSSATTP